MRMKVLTPAQIPTSDKYHGNPWCAGEGSTSRMVFDPIGTTLASI
jgi:hypothetical protein